MNIGIVEVFNTNGTRVGGFKPLPKFASVFPYLEKGDSPYMMFRDTTLNTVLKTKLKWHLIDPPRDTVLDLIDLGNGYYDAQIAGDSVEIKERKAVVGGWEPEINHIRAMLNTKTT